MKKVFLSVFVALCALSAYAGDHVIVVKSDDLGHKHQTEVTIDDDGRTEIINVITGDVVKVLVKDSQGCIVSFFTLTAEEAGGIPVAIPSLLPGEHVEIWVNNRLIYFYFD